MSIHYKLFTLLLSTLFTAFAFTASAQKYDYVVEAEDNEDVVIYVDGERMGSAPRRISIKFNPKKGVVSHTIELRRKGYKNWTQKVSKPDTHKLVRIKGTMVKDVKTIENANSTALKLDKIVFGIDEGGSIGKRTGDGSTKDIEWTRDLQDKSIPKVKRVFRQVLNETGVNLEGSADTELYGEEKKSRYLISLKVLNINVKEWGGISRPSMLGEGTVKVVIYDTEQKKVIYENMKTAEIEKVSGAREENIAALVEKILYELINTSDLLDEISKL